MTISKEVLLLVSKSCRYHKAGYKAILPLFNKVTTLLGASSGITLVRPVFIHTTPTPDFLEIPLDVFILKNLASIISSPLANESVAVP